MARGCLVGHRECWILIGCDGLPLHEPPKVDGRGANPRVTGEEMAKNAARYLNRRGAIGTPVRVLRVRYPWPLPGDPPAAAAPAPPGEDFGDVADPGAGA